MTPLSNPAPPRRLGRGPVSGWRGLTRPHPLNRAGEGHACAGPDLAPGNGLQLPPPEVGSRTPGRAGRSVAAADWVPGPRDSRFCLRAMAPAKATNVVQLLLGSTALWLSQLGAGTVAASKSVTAHLAAKWPETPLLLEARWVRAGPWSGRLWARCYTQPRSLRARSGCLLASTRLLQTPPLWP